MKGDWTSNWDIFYQGEFERHKKARLSQNQLLSAEKLSTLSGLLDNSKRTNESGNQPGISEVCCNSADTEADWNMVTARLKITS
ncbi:MAG: hypothetical protein MZV64_69350 [Ignavibacteriales bacterium]|nr:hypothetical protein [Ignavibacteriales bacterium]